MARIVAFTGHRPDKLGGYGKEIKTRLRRLARYALADRNAERAVIGMALGWDQAAGWACVDLGLPFTAAIPFKGQESRWPYDSQREFNDLLGKAARIVVVSPGRYEPWKMQLRNEWMVENSDELLALWNGTRGGTANCLDYAAALRKPVVNYWKDYNDGRL